jgi:membrane-bound metal-dependent hydrolase YbcI (DUF457 family)
VPDAVTHLCSGLLLHALAPEGQPRRYAPLFVAGAVLPDLLSRAPAGVLSLVHGHLVPLPPVLLYCWAPLHLPAGIALWSALLALLTPVGQRPRAFLALLAGGGLHVALDLCQRHVGLGYPLLAPFSSRDFELGLMGSESTVAWVPVTVAVTGVAWALSTLRRRRRGGPR